MTIVELAPVVQENLEELLLEELATPCDCDHERCSPGCKGHHLELPTVDKLTGRRDDAPGPPSKAPCPQAAAWMVSFKGELDYGYIPPAPRYLCDDCKNYWSHSTFLTLTAERL